MFVNFLQCFILFLPIALTKNFSNTTSSKSLPTEDLHIKYLRTNKTIIPLITEGGPITLLNVSIPAPKENRTDLLSLDKTLLEVDEHTVSLSHSKIKPRKGAGNQTEENSTNEYRSTLRQDTTTNHSHTLPLVNAIKNKTQNISKNSTPKDVKVPHTPNNQTITPEMTHKNKTEKVLPKKPLLLSYEKLASMDEHSMAPVNITKMSEAQSTANPKAVNNELPKLSTPMAMKSSMLSAGHPEMVIPVVITMVVVPMFALLGYMALKRGKEAWQNRHYKRMDFLLDGMYND